MAINYRDRGFKDVCLVAHTTGNSGVLINPVTSSSINLIGYSAHSATPVLFACSAAEPTQTGVGGVAHDRIVSVGAGGFNFPGTIKLPVGTGVYFSPGTSPDHCSIFYFLSN